MVASQRDPVGGRRRKSSHGLARHHGLGIIKLNEPRAHMAALCFGFTALALALWFQPSRFGNTPSYANLLNIFRPHTWAVLYAIPAVLMILSLWHYTAKKLVILTHALTIALLAVWEFAFVVRWLTDDRTTVVNVLSWGYMLYLATRSLTMMGAHTKRGE
jgi:hypothetical protein